MSAIKYVLATFYGDMKFLPACSQLWSELLAQRPARAFHRSRRSTSIPPVNCFIGANVDAMWHILSNSVQDLQNDFQEPKFELACMREKRFLHHSVRLSKLPT
ncbi:uncharacterized protein LAJ45_11103 [Morchella importuna]|uniref:uncharacterized protein n=1 Tax=Morchella importuna TaxID=1174673 RepID=UPI001E8CB22D|nr:uncharacterized protein LAJ45_11103 [Morchella importuna]KAH8144897.1 hypothetical protein LAJ45_11103 [Morchella importuna]